jgi:hypothetical protein
MESGAIIAVTLQAADLGDTTTVHLTLAAAGLAASILTLSGTNRSGKPQYRLAWNSATFTTGC